MGALEAGQSFGRYTVIYEVSADPLFTTYRAYDSKLARDVTLKVLSPTLAKSEALRERFDAITLALVELAHPNILDVHDAGEIDGMLFVAMPPVEGMTLAQRLAQGQLTPAEIGRIVEQVAAALQHAHQHGLTHGVLNLNSILLDAHGNAILSDLDSALLQHKATPSESARQRLDIYLLGALLLLLSSGKASPGEGESVADALKPWVELLPPSVRARAAERYERLLSRAFASDLAKRFPAVGDFLAELRQANASLAPAPPTAPPQAAPSAAEQSEVTHRAVHEARTRALEAGYEAERREREQTARRSLEETQARVQREVAERTEQLRRALAEREAVARAKPQSEALSRAREAIDVQKREARLRLLQVLKAVAEKRARGEKPVQAAMARPLSQLTTTAQRVQPRTMPTAVQTPSKPRVSAQDLSRAQSAARAQAETIRQQAAAGTGKVVRRTRPLFVSIGILLFLIICVFPALCFVCVVAFPLLETTPTPTAATAAQTERASTAIATRAVAATPVPLPTRAPTASPTSTRVVIATPTRTSVVSPTPTALVTTLVFSDSFRSGGCLLPEGETARLRTRCADGEYLITGRGGGAGWVTYEQVYGNLVVEADLRVISSTNSLEYGILWRASPAADQFYGFTLKPGGQTAVFIYRNARYSYFISGLTFSAVNSGAATNHIKVTANQTRLSFGVNNRDLPFSFTDSILRSGTVGFFVGSNEPDAQVAISNLRIWGIGPIATQSPPVGLPTATPVR